MRIIPHSVVFVNVVSKGGDMATGALVNQYGKGQVSKPSTAREPLKSYLVAFAEEAWLSGTVVDMGKFRAGFTD